MSFALINDKHRLHVCTRLAPLSELGDANQAVLLKGSVLDSGCRGLAGATVDVWYAGGRDNTGGNTTIHQVDDGDIM